tara:strand:+ start:645 stop:1328 length:684 start_codon:yes stop_codon:yes gene_type:complete
MKLISLLVRYLIPDIFKKHNNYFFILKFKQNTIKMEKYKIIYFDETINLEDIKEQLKNYSLEETVIFVKEGTETIITDLDSVMNKINILLDNYDIFYLSNVMDSCSGKLNVIEEINGLKFYVSSSPNGFYATASKKKNWVKILRFLGHNNFKNISDGLNNLVVSGDISALTSWPRIYNPKNNYGFYPCRDESITEKKSSPEYEMSVYYFIVSCLILTIFLTTFHRYS